MNKISVKSEIHQLLLKLQYGGLTLRYWDGRLYLLSNAANFRGTVLDIHQLLFSKGLNNDLPMTLDSIYRDA